MRKKRAGILLGMACCAVLAAGCGKNTATDAVRESTETEKEGSGDDAETEAAQTDTGRASDDAEVSAENSPEALKKIGILFPTAKTDPALVRDQEKMTEILENAGYAPDFRFADEDGDAQIGQIKELLENENLKALVVMPVDEYALTEVLDEAGELKIPVFDYDKLIMDTDDLKYYVTFDTRALGHQIAENIVKLKELKKVQEAGETLSIEFFMGEPSDRAELFLFNGIMEELEPYFEDGTLVCRSERVSYDAVAVEDRDVAAVRKNFEEITDEFYKQEGSPDIICTAYDDFAQEIVRILEKENAVQDENWPLITGVDAQRDSVKLIVEEKQKFTVYLDREDLAETCANLILTYFSDEDPEVKNYGQYDNGLKIIGTVTCDGRIIDADNYQLLVDKGIYTEDELTLETEEEPADEEKASVTEAPDVTAIPSPKAEPTAAPSPKTEPTSTPSPTKKAEPTSTPSLTKKAEPTSTPSPTKKAEPTSTPSPTKKAEPTSTPSPAEKADPTAASVSKKK